MAKLRDVFVVAAVTLVFATGMACSAGPLMGQAPSSLGFATFGIGMIFRSF